MFHRDPRGLLRGTDPEIPSTEPSLRSATGDSIKGGTRGYRGSAPRPGCRSFEAAVGHGGRSLGSFLVRFFPRHPAPSALRTVSVWRLTPFLAMTPSWPRSRPTI